MQVGEQCTIPKERAQRAKTYAHVYANQTGKRMTWKANPDGSITVTRLPDAAELSIEFTEDELATLYALFPDIARLKRFGRILAGRYRLYRTEDGGARFESRNAESVTL